MGKVSEHADRRPETWRQTVLAGFEGLADGRDVVIITNKAIRVDKRHRSSNNKADAPSENGDR